MNRKILLEALDRVGTPLCVEAALEIRALEKLLRQPKEKNDEEVNSTTNLSGANRAR